MGIGVSVFLIAVGAILAFAVDAELSGLDIAVVGYILMAAGVLGIAFTLYLSQRTTSPAQRDTYRDRENPPRDLY